MLKISRLLQSIRYSFRGLWKSFKEEQNLRIQVFAAIVVVGLGIYFRITLIEWSLLVLSIGFVFIAELLNSAIERVSDVLKPRINGYVKEIKDIMAGTVMLASIIAIVVGLLVFLPYIIRCY